MSFSILFRKINVLFLLLLFGISISGQIILSDDFSSSNSNWQDINISGGGSFNLSNGIMNLTSDNNTTYGVYHNKVLSGHFYVEVEIGTDDNTGLILFNAQSDGTPDLNNYSLIKVEEQNGVPVVSISDKQNGYSDILDNTGALSVNEKAIRYQNTLDANTYSIPYTSTNTF